MAKKIPKTFSQRRKAAQRRLEKVNYVPVAAKIIADILLGMARYDTPEERKTRLRVFYEIVEDEVKALRS